MKDERKLEIKSRMKEYLQRIGVDLSGTHFRCLHPDHSEKSPSMKLNNDDRVYCFGCKKRGDIFDVIGWKENLTDHKEIFQKAEELFGCDTSAPEPPKRPKQYHRTPKPQKDYSAYYKRVCPQIRQTDYLLKRGISYEVAERAKVGFDPRFKTDGVLNPSIIIFTGQFSYTVRSVLPNPPNNLRVMKIGASRLYMDELLSTAKRPLIVVEGEIDALSVWEVGGCAMALGSASNDTLFVKRVAELKPDIQLVLSLDNDESGRAATASIASELKAMNIDFTVSNISGEYKDPSEALQLNREEFLNKVREVYR